MSTTTRPYRLAEDSHVCATSQGAIFLDLRADAYFGVDAQQAAALADLVEGWPRAAAASVATSTTSLNERHALARSLCERGLLTAADDTASDIASRAQPLTVPPVTDEFVAWDQMPRPSVRLHDVYTFARALLRA